LHSADLAAKPQILLVEDSPLTAKAVADLMRQSGYATETVASGEEAVRLISSGFPAGLILMDIALAGKMDGIDAARQIAECRDVPVVFLTASTSPEIAERIKNVSAYGFVLKGAHQTALLSAVELALKLHAAKTQAAMFEQLFENMLSELYIFHPDSLKFAAVNRAARKNLGYSSEELAAMTVPDIKPEFSASRLRELIASLRRDGQAQVTFETVHRRKDGSRYPVEVRLELFNYRGDRFCLATVTDLTEKKRLEEEKMRQEALCRLMIEGIPHPCWLISRERRILAQNKAAAALVGPQVGNYCWQAIHGGKYLPDLYRQALEQTGRPLPGTQCYFCRSDAAMARQEAENSEVAAEEAVWDTWWIPLNENIYLHYVNDITKYKKAEEELYSLSQTDCLTGAYNRRYCLQQLTEETERSRRTGNAFSLIMLDIDRFKDVNDRFGHNAGDLVLKSMADHVRNRIRRTDTFARWGGEEFVILLPDTPPGKAAVLAESLRETISRMEVPGVGKVTASFGVAAWRPQDTVDTLVQRADSAMYAAKAAGRNAVRQEEP